MARQNVNRGQGRDEGGPSDGFTPTYLEIKGFCEWEERKKKGATRKDADDLMALLTPALPEELQDKIGKPQLRGLRNYSIKIGVDPEFIWEIKGIWKEQIEEGVVVGPQGREIFVTVEKSPEQKKKNGIMGKLVDFAKDKSIESIKAFWAPDYAVYAEFDGGLPPQLIASLSSEGVIMWEDDCGTVLNLGDEGVAEAFRRFRRP